MGDNVMGSFRTNRPPRGRRLGRGRGFRTFRLVRRWFRHESGGIERIAWPLTGSVCSFIVRSIPEGLMFREFSSIWEIQVKTKGEIALELIDAGIAAAVPTEAVLADAGYGDQPRFLDGLEIRGLPYLVGVASTTRFRLAQDVEEDSGEQPAPPYQGQGRPRRARRLEDRIPSREANALLEELLQDAWQAITWREGTKGNLTKEFTRVRVYRVGRRGKPLPTAGWLIGQRPLPGQQGESKYCFAWGLDSLSLQDQVVLAHNRWVIERFYQDAKGELGLDDYEGRFWTGLHRHVALVMMAHSFLSIRRNHGLPPQTDSTDGPRQFPSATSVAGFPP